MYYIMKLSDTFLKGLAIKKKLQNKNLKKYFIRLKIPGIPSENAFLKRT